MGSGPLGNERALTEWIRKVLKELEVLVVKHGLRAPAVYAVVFFDDRSMPSERSALKLSDDVFIGEGYIAIKITNVLPLLVERVAAGYFALSLIASGESPNPDRVWYLARKAVVPVLARLALSS